MSSFIAPSQFIEGYHGPSFGMATALALGSLIVASELIAPRLRRSDKDVHLIGKAARTYAFAGLTHRDATFMAPVIEPEIGGVDYVHYSSRNGVKPATIAKELSEHFSQRETGSMNIIGHSLGLLTGLLSVQACVQQGVQVPHIDTIWGLGGPKDHEDIRHWERYQNLPSFTNVFDGFMTQYMGHLITNVATGSDKMLRFRQAAVAGIKNRHSDQSPAQWGLHLELPQREGSLLDMGILADAGVIDAATEVKLGYDKDDPVIFAEAAAEKWATAFKKVGCQVEVAMSDSDKHIDLSALPADYWRSAVARVGL